MSTQPNTTVKTKDEPFVLQTFTLEDTKKDLPTLIEETQGNTAQKNPTLDKKAAEIIERLMNIDPKDLREQQSNAQSISSLGGHISEQLAHKSEMLKEPMKTLMDDSNEGSDVANTLLELQRTVSNINPNRVDFDMGTIRRLLSKLPGVGTPLSNWFARYQSVEGVLGDIMTSLKDGRGKLQRDNVTLTEDQLQMRELTFSLADYIEFGHIVDKKLTAEMEALPASDERRKFLEEEVLFPLKQRILDLQQQLAVNQQGVLVIETIVRNNKELIRGVDRTLNVTINALSTASTLAIALQHQKKVLEGVNAVNKATDDLIVSTSEQLKNQGVAIQKQAASASLDIEGLKKAFSNVDSALKDISTFRREALPKMAESIVEMDSLTVKMEESIQNMEKGTDMKKQLTIEL